MLWYGSRNDLKKSYASISTNKSNQFALKKRKNSLNFKKNYIYQIATFFFYIPSMWNLSIFKIKQKHFIFFFYSLTYFFFLPFTGNYVSFRVCLSSHAVSFFLFYKNNFFYTFFSSFKKLFYAFSKVFFKKLKFKGKGYYIYKNKRNTIAFQFGYSHIRRLFFFYTFVKFLSKTSIIIFGLNPKSISTTSLLIRKVRPINVFTGKGVRFTRQIIYRKTGKISSYR